MFGGKKVPRQQQQVDNIALKKNCGRGGMTKPSNRHSAECPRRGDWSLEVVHDLN
jgi:hypothetical protein